MEEALIFVNMYFETYTLFLFLIKLIFSDILVKLNLVFVLTVVLIFFYVNSQTAHSIYPTPHTTHPTPHTPHHTPHTMASIKVTAVTVWAVALQRVEKIKNEINSFLK